MRRRSISALSYSLMVVLVLWTANASWAKSEVATNASELEKLLENEDIAEIAISAGSEIAGNFKIERKVLITSVSDNPAIFRAADSEKPVFTVNQSLMSSFKSKDGDYGLRNLKIVGGDNKISLKIECILENFRLENVNFYGIKENENTGAAISSGTYTIDFTNCNFENLKFGIAYESIWSDTFTNLNNVTFKNVSQSITSLNDNLVLNMTNCKWQGKGIFGIYLHHNFDDDVRISLDDKSFAEMKNNPIYPFLQCRDDQIFKGGSEISDFEAVLKERHKKLAGLLHIDPAISLVEIPHNPFIAKIKDRVNNIDALTAYVLGMWIKYTSEELTKENIRNLLSLYYITAVGPFVIKRPFLPSDTYQMKFNPVQNASVKGLYDNLFVEDIFMPLVLADNGSAAPLNTANLSLSIGGKNALDTIKQLPLEDPDRRLRDNINFYFSWLKLVQTMNSNSETLKKYVQSNFLEDLDFVTNCYASLRAINDLTVTVDRIMRIYLFDLPMDITFLIGYAKTLHNSDNKSDVMFTARQVAQYYPIANKLCLLKTTNMFQNTILKNWKEILKKEQMKELEAILSTEPQILMDKKDIESFFKDWR